MKNLIKCFQISCVFFLIGVGMVHGTDADGQLSPTKNSNHTNDNERQILDLSQSTGSTRSCSKSPTGKDEIKIETFISDQFKQDAESIIQKLVPSDSKIHIHLNFNHSTTNNYYECKKDSGSTVGLTSVRQEKNEVSKREILEQINTIKEELGKLLKKTTTTEEEQERLKEEQVKILQKMTELENKTPEEKNNNPELKGGVSGAKKVNSKANNDINTVLGLDNLYNLDNIYKQIKNNNYHLNSKSGKSNLGH